MGEPVISRLGASKGQLIVPVAGAVYDQGDFVGVLAASVKLKPLTERYLALMKVSDQTDVYLVNQRGELLYSSSAPDTVGASIFQVFPELEQALSTTGEGNLQASRRLIAYAPISLDSQNWWLVMASPVEDIRGVTVPIYIRQLALLLLVGCSMVIFGVVAARDASV